MKTIKVILLALAMFACSAYAQNEQHFTFMGIPIDGPLATFENSLLAKGFTPQKKCTDNTSTQKWYEGVFFGEHVALSVNLTPRSHNVYMISMGTTSDMTEEEATSFLKRLDTTIKAKYQIDKIEKVDVDNYYYVNNHIGVISSNYTERITTIIYLDMKNKRKYDSECEIDV